MEPWQSYLVHGTFGKKTKIFTKVESVISRNDSTGAKNVSPDGQLCIEH